MAATSKGELRIKLPPGAAFCLSPAAQPFGLSGDDYRRARAQAAWGIQALSATAPINKLGAYDWRSLADLVEHSSFAFLAAMPHVDFAVAETDLCVALQKAFQENHFPQVVRWSLIDRQRVTLVPPGHRLLMEDTAPFRASLELSRGAQHVQSIAVGDFHVASFSAPENPGDGTLFLERYTGQDQKIEASIRFLSPEPEISQDADRTVLPTDLVLLTNGRGGMARLCADLGRVNSKYDCVLGANLHPAVPVDRHIFAKRIRVWVNANGFITPLDFQNLALFDAGPPAVWSFVANAGDGHTVQIEVRAEMVEGSNTTQFHFARPSEARAAGKQLPAEADVRLTVRVDIEDRNFHTETKHDSGAEFHFSSNTRALEIPNLTGFAFTPAPDRQLRVFADAGKYHPQAEWCDNIAHPIDQTRGQVGSGDAYSPGWFELPLPKGAAINLVVTAEPDMPLESHWKLESPGPKENFEARLLEAARAFVVRRESGKSVIAGYPWFLDWGRDTLISARGLLAAGMVEEVRQILTTFARFEKDGTLPNIIFGNDASNRDTSDAPLWFGIVWRRIGRGRIEWQADFLYHASG